MGGERGTTGLACLALLSCGSRTELPGLEGPLPGTPGAPPSALNCPTGPADPRLPALAAGVASTLDGSLFVQGTALAYRWKVLEEDCDALADMPTYLTSGTDEQVLTFLPSRPSSYRVALEVLLGQGRADSCEFELPVSGQGMRVELCWDTSSSVDLDLYLHSPRSQAPFFASAPSVDPALDSSFTLIAAMSPDVCNPVNCGAELRGDLSRVDFGYADSALGQCASGPSAAEFLALGKCPNPRAGIDNNQTLASGTSEVIQLDTPNDGDTLRVMVQNFENLPAKPEVYVYCGGRRVSASLSPAEPSGFVAQQARGLFGVMWRPVDVVVRTRPDGATDCDVIPLTHPDGSGQPYVTVNDPAY